MALTGRQTEHLVDGIIGKRFTIGQYVAGGSFGSFHFGYECNTGEKVAIKLEKKQVPQPQLQLEYYYYQSLGEVRFIPKVYYIGPCPGDEWHGLVMELLGPTLNGMRNKCGGKFSIQTTTLVMYQLVKILYYVHEHGIIYRDVKPENFLIGPANTDKWYVVHLIDMGFCKRYLTDENFHIPYVEGKPIAGTQRYMSINNHLGHELSRRDDLEAILYMAVYLNKAEVPWQGLEGTPMEKNRQTVQLKQSTPPEELCSSMPSAFAEFLQTVREYQFDERPNYGQLMNKFYQALIHLGTRPEEHKYDWDREHNPVGAVPDAN